MPPARQNEQTRANRKRQELASMTQDEMFPDANISYDFETGDIKFTRPDPGRPRPIDSRRRAKETDMNTKVKRFLDSYRAAAKGANMTDGPKAKKRKRSN